MASISQNLVDEIFAAALPYLEAGRKNWDVPHTKACMHWMTELLKHEHGNARILMPAIILHDIGIHKPTTQFADMMLAKKEHMRLGAELAATILTRFPFEEEEIARIVHLVGMHDDLTKIQAEDEQLLFEADSLGQIDVQRVQPTQEGVWRQKFIEHFQKDRNPLLKTKTALKAHEYLWPTCVSWKRNQ